MKRIYSCWGFTIRNYSPSQILKTLLFFKGAYKDEFLKSSTPGNIVFHQGVGGRRLLQLACYKTFIVDNGG